MKRKKGNITLACALKTKWCTNKDVKTCQMKSASRGVTGGGNQYFGVIVPMCKECRKERNGQFKLVNYEK